MLFIKKVLKNIWSSIGFSAFTAFLFFYPFKSNNTPLFPYADKVIHIGLFFILTTLWLLTRKTVKEKNILVIILMAYAILVEFIQDWMGMGRSFDLYDIIADYVGIVLSGYSFKKLKLEKVFHY